MKSIQIFGRQNKWSRTSWGDILCQISQLLKPLFERNGFKCLGWCSDIVKLSKQNEIQDQDILVKWYCIAGVQLQEKSPLKFYGSDAVSQENVRVDPSVAAWLDDTQRTKNQGPVVQSVVSLTRSLRVISLSVLADSIHNILIFFAEKMWVAFALQKLLTFFQQKISAYLRITRCKF